MLCKRVSSIVKKAKTELEEIRLRQRAVSEKLIGTCRTVLESLDPDAEEPAAGPARAVAAVEEAGGFAAQLAGIEEVSAYHGDNYEVLVHRFFRMDRATMFDLAGKLGLVATSSDASVLTALGHARAWHSAQRDHIPLPPPADGQDADSGLAFAPARHGGRVHRAAAARPPSTRMSMSCSASGAATSSTGSSSRGTGRTSSRSRTMSGSDSMLVPSEREPRSAERRMIAAATIGAVTDLTTGDSGDDDPARGDSWDASRQIRAELLAELITRTHRIRDEPPRAVKLCGVRVTGVLDLEAATLICPLLESLDGEVRVHHVRRSLDIAEIGPDRYQPPGLAQWCQLSVRGDGGGKHEPAPRH
jgi:hypothetical protein